MTITKPQINFNIFTSTYVNDFLKIQYSKIDSTEKFIDFTFHCLSIGDDEPKGSLISKECLALFNYLYQKTTRKSYQSKISI